MIKPIAIALSAPALVAATPPTDRSYVMAHTDRAPETVAACAQGFFAGHGAADNTPADYGRRVDYRFKNLGGAVKEPTMTLEVHNDGSLIFYGFKTFRAQAGSGWKTLSKTCFPELAGAPVVKQ
jgi:hypothetical protein